LNKADGCGELAARIAEVEQVAMGIAVFGERANWTGHRAARTFLAAGRTVVLLVSSGAGKSTWSIA